GLDLGRIETRCSNSSSCNQALQVFVERRIRNGNRLRAANQCLSFGLQTSNTECHCDSMVAETIDVSSMKFLATGDSHAVFKLLDRCSHCAQVFHYGADPVRFFYSQFTSIADLDTFFCVRADRRQY